jgi:hypothetical protein
MASAVPPIDGSNDDLQIIDFQPAKNAKRPRGLPLSKPSPPLSAEYQELCSQPYSISSVDAFKDALARGNPDCVVWLWSTSGRFVSPLWQSSLQLTVVLFLMFLLIFQLLNLQLLNSQLLDLQLQLLTSQAAPSPQVP